AAATKQSARRACQTLSILLLHITKQGEMAGVRRIFYASGLPAHRRLIMRRRLYWLLPDVESARRTVDDLLLARIEDRHMHVLARRGTDLADDRRPRPARRGDSGAPRASSSRSEQSRDRADRSGVSVAHDLTFRGRFACHSEANALSAEKPAFRTQKQVLRFAQDDSGALC